MGIRGYGGRGWKSAEIREAKKEDKGVERKKGR